MKDHTIYKHAGYFYIGNTMHTLIVYVEGFHGEFNDDPDCVCDDIANKAIQESGVLKYLFPHLDKRYFAGFSVRIEDSFDDDLTDLYASVPADWDYEKLLYGSTGQTMFNARIYKTALRVTRKWFDGEEHFNFVH